MAASSSGIEMVVLGAIFVVVGIVYVFGIGIYVKSVRRIRARYGLRGPEQRGNDEFINENGYSWDFALVLPIYGSDEAISKYQRQYSLRYILERLAHESIETRTCIMTEKSILVKMRAPISRLHRVAIENKYLIELDANALRHRCQSAKTSEKKEWASLRLKKDIRFSWLDPYAYCYAPFTDTIQSLWRRPMGEPAVLRGIDRIRLIKKIVENDCGLALKKLIQEDVLTSSFGIHEYSALRSIETDWRLNLFICGKSTPLNEVRDYFGERIAMYIGLTEKYTLWLSVLSVFGVWAWIAEAGSVKNMVIIYSCILSMWTMLFALFWEETQNRLALAYGTLNYEREETERPEYRQSKNGKLIDSPITGRPQTYFYKSEGNRFDIQVRKCVILMLWLVLILGFVSMQWSLKDCCSEKKSDTEYIFGFLDAVRVQVFMLFVPSIANFIARLQNSRTQTQHNDARIYFILILRAINAYASLSYVAFIRPFSPQPCAFADDCLRELRVLYVTTLLIRTPFLVFFTAKPADTTKNIFFIRLITSLVHQTSSGTHFDDDAAAFTDIRLTRFLELFFYLVCFSAAFPPAAFLCLGLAWSNNKLDCLALLSKPKRPFPDQAQDLGAHHTVLQLAPIFAIASNAAILILTGRYVDALFQNQFHSAKKRATARLLAFLLFEHVLLGFRFMLSSLFFSRDNAVIKLQAKRHKFILSKVLFNVPDTEDDPLLLTGGADTALPTSSSSSSSSQQQQSQQPKSPLSTRTMPPPSFVIYGNDEDWTEIRGASAVNIF